MRTPDRERAEAVFEAALDLEAGARESFVSRACGDDAEMRRIVLALLAASARSHGVLEADAAAFMQPDEPPRRLGAYRVLREIGRGGMGVVYDAERDDGQFRRRVAIKIMAGEGAELQQRVLAERQILAALDHPHIARLLDGGVADDGRPYIVMEYVDGLPVDVYCDRMRLGVAERLRLFVTIARAVDAAHRSLVVHRDLKPSNVLVTPDGTVKLLDFGVAKLLNPWLTGGGAPLTRDRAALTPEYASPEQIRGDALTTTTDVYSLGVMLYELLAGRRPYAQHEHDPAALMQAVCSGDIERPSARVLRAEPLTPSREGGSTVVQPAELARARDTTPQRLARQLRGDCDAIVAMALRVEPPRRYISAELLAQDLERHLAGRAVRAHQGSRGYALRKLVLRHRAEALALVTAAVALAGGAAAAAWQAASADRERLRAEAALGQSEQITEFLLELFESGNPAAAVSGTPTARDLVRRGTERIDGLAGQPLLQARMLGVLGRIHESLGEYEDAQRLTDRALGIHTAAHQPEDAELAELILQRGILQRRRGEYDSAQASFMRARAIQERVLGAGDAALSRTLQQLASIAIYRGDLPEAERRAEEALELQRRALGPGHRQTVNSLRYVGAVKWRRGKYDEAERVLREAIVLRPGAAGSTREEAFGDRLQLAELLLTMERNDEADAVYRDVQGELRSDLPEEVNLGVWTRSGRAVVAERRGDLVASERLRRDVLQMRAGVFGDAHPTVGLSKAHLAAVLIKRGELEEAERLLDDALNISLQVYGDRSLHHAVALVDLAGLRSAQGRLAEADSLIGRALHLQRGYQLNTVYAERLRLRADVQLRMGRFEDAERLLNEALEIATSRVAESAVNLRDIHETFVRLYTAWGRAADAARHRQLMH